MRFMVVGINHETAPVEIRERVSISDLALDDVLSTLRTARSVLESVVVSTCNRTEFYCVVSSERAGSDFLSSQLARIAGESVDKMRSHIYMKSGQEAVHHLFRVVCGLDSMVVGETQILGQVRAAYLTAADQGNIGALLDRCFRLAIQTGKRAQTETGIGQNPVSVSYAAVQLVKKIVGDLADRQVLLIGAGKMNALSLQHLKSSGATRVGIANRTLERAAALAATAEGVSAVPWSQLDDALSTADVVVVSTNAKEFVVSGPMVAAAQRRRNHKPMVVIDIAVPRNVDPAVGDVRQVFYFDIDDLNGVVAANVEERRRAVSDVERLIAGAMSEFADWLTEQSVVPVISAIRQRGIDIQSSVMESLRNKLPALTDRELSLIHKHTMSIVNQLLRDPIQNMKELAIASGSARQAEEFARLFGVDTSVLSSASTDMMDGFKYEANEGMAGLAAALRTFGAAWLSDRALDSNPGEKNLRQAAR